MRNMLKPFCTAGLFWHCRGLLQPSDLRPIEAVAAAGGGGGGADDMELDAPHPLPGSSLVPAAVAVPAASNGVGAPHEKVAAATDNGTAARTRDEAGSSRMDVDGEAGGTATGGAGGGSGVLSPSARLPPQPPAAAAAAAVGGSGVGGAAASPAAAAAVMAPLWTQGAGTSSSSSTLHKQQQAQQQQQGQMQQAAGTGAPPFSSTWCRSESQSPPLKVPRWKGAPEAAAAAGGRVGGGEGGELGGAAAAAGSSGRAIANLAPQGQGVVGSGLGAAANGSGAVPCGNAFNGNIAQPERANGEGKEAGPGPSSAAMGAAAAAAVAEGPDDAGGGESVHLCVKRDAGADGGRKVSMTGAGLYQMYQAWYQQRRLKRLHAMTAGAGPEGGQSERQAGAAAVGAATTAAAAGGGGGGSGGGEMVFGVPLPSIPAAVVAGNWSKGKGGQQGLGEVGMEGVVVKSGVNHTSPAAAGTAGAGGGSICHSALAKQAPIQQLLQLLKQGEFAAAEKVVEAVQPGLLRDNLGLRFELKRCQFCKVRRGGGVCGGITVGITLGITLVSEAYRSVCSKFSW